MKRECLLNTKILRKTIEIHESFPELSIFLDEVKVDAYPVEKTDRCSGLKEYYDSLEALLNSYKSNVRKK